MCSGHTWCRRSDHMCPWTSTGGLPAQLLDCFSWIVYINPETFQPTLVEISIRPGCVDASHTSGYPFASQLIILAAHMSHITSYILAFDMGYCNSRAVAACIAW